MHCTEGSRWSPVTPAARLTDLRATLGVSGQSQRSVPRRARSRWRRALGAIGPASYRGKDGAVSATSLRRRSISASEGGGGGGGGGWRWRGPRPSAATIAASVMNPLREVEQGCLPSARSAPLACPLWQASRPGGGHFIQAMLQRFFCLGYPRYCNFARVAKPATRTRSAASGPNEEPKKKKLAAPDRRVRPEAATAGGAKCGARSVSRFTLAKIDLDVGRITVNGDTRKAGGPGNFSIEQRRRLAVLVAR